MDGTKPKRKRKSKKPKVKGINWRWSMARTIILDDLEKGHLPLDSNALSAEDAWDKTYKHLHEFRDIPFGQFEKQLEDHRKQTCKKKRHVMKKLHSSVIVNCIQEKRQTAGVKQNLTVPLHRNSSVKMSRTSSMNK